MCAELLTATRLLCMKGAQWNVRMHSLLMTILFPVIIPPLSPCSLSFALSVPFFLLPVLAFLPSLLFLPSPSWHSALSLIVDNWVGGAVGWPCLCVQRASGQVNGALVSSWEHSVALFFSVRSLTWPVNLSLSVNFPFLSRPKLFPAVSI